MTVHSERACRALAHLSEADPALAALALWCEHRDGVGNTRTEGDAILYGPEFPLRPLAEQVGLAGHHVLHVALRHPARMAAMGARLGQTFDAGRYNLAADAVVNEAMLRAGHALPRPAPRLAEMVDRAEDALADWDVDRLFMRLEREGRTGGRGRDDSAERDLYAGGQPADGDAKAAEWRGRLARALDTGRRAGRGIGHAAADLVGLPEAQVAWEVRLRGLVARAVSEVPRRSYRRPASRWVAMQIGSARRGRPGARVRARPCTRPPAPADRRRDRQLLVHRRPYVRALRDGDPGRRAADRSRGACAGVRRDGPCDRAHRSGPGREHPRPDADPARRRDELHRSLAENR